MSVSAFLLALVLEGGVVIDRPQPKCQACASFRGRVVCKVVKRPVYCRGGRRG